MSDAWSKAMAQMMAQGAEMAKAMAPAMETMAKADAPSMADFMPKMPPEMLELWMGKTMNPDGLDAKTRLLVTLAGLTVQGAVAEDAVTVTVRNALSAGATGQEIAETIAQMAPLGGVPAMQKAMELAQAEIEKAQGEEA